MSHFYGKVQGSRGEATRSGSKKSGLVTYSASYEGAIRVEIYYNENTKSDYTRIDLVKWIGKGIEATLYEGPVDPEEIVENKNPAGCRLFGSKKKEE